MALQLYSILPSPPVSKGFAQDVFSVFFEQWFGEQPFTKRNKIGIHSVSNADKNDFGLSWTIRIMGRLDVFSLQSATSYAEGGVGGSQAIKQCWEGRGKPWSLVGRATTEHWGKVSLSCFSQQDICPSMEETCPILSLESHFLLYTCSTSHHSEITSMTTFTCTPLNRTKQIQASLFRADWSHHSKPDSGPSREEPARTAPCTSLTQPLKSTSTWLCCGMSAQLEQTRVWHLQQPQEMPNEEQMAGLEAGAATKSKWWTADFWDTSSKKCLLGRSNKPDSTSSSSSYFTKGCFSATNCSLWEKPRFNLHSEGRLTIIKGSLCWSMLW